MERTAVRGRLTWQAATVASVTQETDSVVTIELDPPHWPGHRAGQHLDVRLTADDGYQAEREYSIASAPGEPPAITVERLEGGEVSPYLTGELRAGDELELRGPAPPGRSLSWSSTGRRRAPVSRCRTCSSVLMVLVKAHGVTCVDLDGLASLGQSETGLTRARGT